MTYIKLSNYVVSTTMSPKLAAEKLKELLNESILDSEEAFNLEFFIEELCSEDLEEGEPGFVLLEQEEIVTVKDIDIEYSDEDIDIMVNDILYSEEPEEEIEEDEDVEDDSEDFENEFSEEDN